MRKTYLLAIVSGVAEKYAVMHALLQKVPLQHLQKVLPDAEFVIAADMKMIWMLTGKSHGGVHPCPFCPWVHGRKFGGCATLRSLRDNHIDYENWRTATSEMGEAEAKKLIRQYNNCSRRSLVDDLVDNDETLVMTLTVPPYLHMKLRVTNKVDADMRNKFPALNDEWHVAAGVHTETYHGEMAGNQCTRLLSKVHILQTLIREECEAEIATELRAGPNRKRRRLSQRAMNAIVTKKEGDHGASRYVALFAALDAALRTAGTPGLHPQLRSSARRLAEAIDNAECSRTVMMHILIDHVPEFCAARKCGMLRYSEEAGESMHHEELKYQQRFHVPAPGNKQHTQYLRLSMLALNADHAAAPIASQQLL